MSNEKTNDGRKGGWLKGKPHYDKLGNPKGGIKAVVVDSGKPVELEGGEVIINKEAAKKNYKELSKINQSAGNGVPILPPTSFAQGGNITLTSGDKVEIGNTVLLKNRKGTFNAKILNITDKWVIFTDLSDGKRKDCPIQKFPEIFQAMVNTSATVADSNIGRKPTTQTVSPKEPEGFKIGDTFTVAKNPTAYTYTFASFDSITSIVTVSWEEKQGHKTQPYSLSEAEGYVKNKSWIVSKAKKKTPNTAISSYQTYEDRVTEMVIELGGMTRSDAQGFVETGASQTMILAGYETDITPRNLALELLGTDSDGNPLPSSIKQKQYAIGDWFNTEPRIEKGFSAMQIHNLNSGFVYYTDPEDSAIPKTKTIKDFEKGLDVGVILMVPNPKSKSKYNKDDTVLLISENEPVTITSVYEFDPAKNDGRQFEYTITDSKGRERAGTYSEQSFTEYTASKAKTKPTLPLAKKHEAAKAQKPFNKDLDYVELLKKYIDTTQPVFKQEVSGVMLIQTLKKKFETVLSEAGADFTKQLLEMKNIKSTDLLK